jgi:hypothetical protein
MSRTYRNRKRSGFNTEKFEMAEADHNYPGKDPRIDDLHWQRTSDTAEQDPLSHQVKPKNKLWNRMPTQEEMALVDGLHIHSAENPLGLHKHINDPNEPLSGAHTHGPSNIYGKHTHKGVPTENQMFSTSGDHIHHTGQNGPWGGKHFHSPEDFSSAKASS